MISLSGVIPFGPYKAFNSPTDLNVPSLSFTAWLHGILVAPGICPPLCACSVGYSGGAVISPVNSFGLLTSTNDLRTQSIFHVIKIYPNVFVWFFFC